MSTKLPQWILAVRGPGVGDGHHVDLAGLHDGGPLGEGDVHDLPVVVGGVAEYRGRVGAAVVGPEAAILAILVDPAPGRQLGVVGTQYLAAVAHQRQAVAVAGRSGGVLLGSQVPGSHDRRHDGDG